MNKSTGKVLVEVGSGERPRAGYIHCDVRPGKQIDFVCSAWAIPFHVESVDEIYARHVLEHLTFAEAQRTLRHWLCVLKVGGRIDINVPDLTKHMEQFLQDGASPYVTFPVSNREHALAGFYGWQRHGYDIHKSGYTFAALSDLLQKTGFAMIKRICDYSLSGLLNLRVTAVKEHSFPDLTVDPESRKIIFTYYKLKNRMKHFLEKKEPGRFPEAERAAGGGERQASPSIDMIRQDHSGRYELALTVIPEAGTVLDVACGVGYGSYIIATKSACSKITAIDSSAEAIAYGRKYYDHSKITFYCDDCMLYPFEEASFDCIVSFETIEHIRQDRQLLSMFYSILKESGVLVCSTPNQNMVPFSPKTHPFHCRHYTPEAFESLLTEAGFSIEQRWSQHSMQSAAVSEGWGGLYMIAVCRKKNIKK